MKRFVIALVATIAVLLPAGSLVQAASCNGASHQAPTLSNGSANPGSGSSTTPITFSVVYTDNAGVRPDVAHGVRYRRRDVRNVDVGHELHGRRHVPGDPGHPRRVAHLLVRSGERIGCRREVRDLHGRPARRGGHHATRHRPRLPFRHLRRRPHRSRFPCRRRSSSRPLHRHPRLRRPPSRRARVPARARAPARRRRPRKALRRRRGPTRRSMSCPRRRSSESDRPRSPRRHPSSEDPSCRCSVPRGPTSGPRLPASPSSYSSFDGGRLRSRERRGRSASPWRPLRCRPPHPRSTTG